MFVVVEDEVVVTHWSAIYPDVWRYLSEKNITVKHYLSIS